MSYYSKYRPSRIQDLDIVAVRDQLNAILQAGSFSHAYLFTGPRGTGKTSTARIIAKVLNCKANTPSLGAKQKALQEPCNECASCTSIATGSSLAVIEIDAASNRGIDDIRTLKEQVVLAPSGGAYCIYIIDEVHMLTTEAFNALLKTIEEPPAHAVFILCTTEAHKVPATIHSRCARIVFNRASMHEIVASLHKAVAGENLHVEAAALDIIAQSAEGSFRDGMKLLEQLSQQNTSISLEMAQKLTGYTSEYNADQLLEVLVQKDMTGALNEVRTRVEQGTDFSLFLKRVVESLRERLVRSVADGSESMTQEYLRLLELITHYTHFQKTSPIPHLPLEMTIVAWCQGSEVVPTSDPSVPAKKLHSAPTTQNPETPATSECVSTDVAPSQSQAMPPNIEDHSFLHKSEVTQLSEPQATVSLSLSEIEAKWSELLALVRGKNVSVEALLKAARPSNAQGNNLTLEVLYAFHKEQLEQQRHRAMVEGVMASLFGGECRINLVLAGSSAKKNSGDVVNVTGILKDEQVAQAVEEIFGT